jgi:diapolycopene oxygenase
MKLSTSESIGIIGGGLAGLAAACTLAPAVIACHPVRNQLDWYRRQGRRPRAGGFRFDMGPTILTLPSVLRRIFTEAGRELEDYLDLRRLDPQWRCFFQDGSVLDLAEEPNAMAPSWIAFRPRNTVRRGLSAVHEARQAARTTFPRSYFFYKPIGGIRDMFQFSTAVSPSVIGDVSQHAHAQHRGRHHPKVRAGSAGRPDARPLHPVRRLLARTIPRRALRHRPHAERRRRLVSHRRHARRPACPGPIWPANSASRSAPTPTSPASSPTATAPSGWNLRDGRLSRSPPWSPIGTPFAPFSELLPGHPASRRFSIAAPTNPPVPVWCSTSACPSLRPPLPSQLRLLPRSPRGIRCHLPERGTRSGPHRLRVRAFLHRTGRCTSGGEALYVLVHTPYLRPHHDWTRMLPEPTVASSSQTRGQPAE